MIFSFFCPTGDESLVFLLRSHFSVEHARTVGWTVAATALRQMGNVLPSYPFQPARLFHLRITNHLVSLGCSYAALCSFAAIARIDQILLAKSGLAHTFPALYAKGDCETQNKESSGETL